MGKAEELTEEIMREMPKAILNWYPFKKESKVLLLSYADELLEIYTKMLKDCGNAVTGMKVSQYEKQNQETGDIYDYVVLADALEYLKSPSETIKRLSNNLKDDGLMLIAMDNRLGLRYFCGDRDAFTERNFDSLEDYGRINENDKANLKGRAYSKAEVIDFLSDAGLCDAHSFSVLPCVEEPHFLYAEDVLPDMDELMIRYKFYYRNPDTIFLEEEKMLKTIIKNGMFHQMAGGYLIECGKKVGEDAAFYTTQQVLISMEKGRDEAVATIIGRDDTVTKKAIYKEGVGYLNNIADNMCELKKRGINVVDGTLDGDKYVMPYIDSESAVTYFRRLFYSDLKLLYRELNRYFEEVLKASDYVSYDDIDWGEYGNFGKKKKTDDPNKLKWKNIAYSKPDGIGKIMKKGFVEMSILNCKVVDGNFVFFDQEHTIDNLPAYSVLWKTIQLIYWGDSEANKIYPIENLVKLMGLGECLAFVASFNTQFEDKLYHVRELKKYHEINSRDLNVLSSNRQRMNYSQEEYQRLFVDIFKGVQGRKLYLFGSGNYAKKFLSQFGKKFKVDGILDNNESRQGSDLLGIQIMSPNVLRDMDPAKYKVIICIKNYVPVLKQMKAIGATNISFYDWNLEYEHEKYIEEEKADKKPYHIGYIAGVFDLFHVGHLNVLRRAKEQCDYLIVGVVSDEGVINSKKTTPYVGFSERIDIVRSCKYVDEAVEIPVECNDTDEAYRRYQFDVQFSGSDYADDPAWLAKQEYLRKHGADLVFFPYTQSTSSTKLKAVISENIPKKKNSGDEAAIVVEINNDNNQKVACMTNTAIDSHRPNQGFEIHKKAGFNEMVINLRSFCSGNDLKNYKKKVVSIDAQHYDNAVDNPKLLWQYAMEEIRVAKEKGMNIPLIVAPCKSRDTYRDDLDDILYELAYQTIQLCKDAKTKYALIYPNSYNQADIEHITAWYDRLVPAAKECGVTILISNQCKDVSGHLVRGVFAHTYDAIEWIDAQNEKYGADTFGFCADIGCYNLCGQRLQEVCVELGSYIKAVIIRENDGHVDSSMLPYTSVLRGATETDYMGLIRGLRTIDYEGILILDMFDTCAAVPTKLRDGLVNLGKSYMDFLVWQIGMEKGLKKYGNRVLFGAGNMCRAYMKCYGEEFPPLFTCDNNPKMWGTEFCGLQVKNPECLMSLPDDCVIYICNMFYNEIKKQLEDMGVTNPIEFFNDEYLPSYHFNRI